MAGYIGNKAVNLSTSGADISGTANLDIVDIDGAVNMATTALVTGVLTTTAAPVFNGGFTANDGSTITTADNTTQLTLISTDADANKGPALDLYRNSGSPAAGDDTGRINFQGENDADEAVTYTQIFTEIVAVGDGVESGRYKVGAMLAGDFASRMDMTASETVFNDDSKDLDFRVESNGNANMLFVDGGNNRVGVGTNLPTDTLNVQAAAAGTAITLVESSDSGSNPAAFIGYRSRGTDLSGHTAIQADNTLTQFSAGAHDGSAFAVGSKILSTASQTWTTSAHGTRLGIFTTPDGTTTPVERCRIDAPGNLLLGRTSSSGSRFQATAATEVAVFQNTSGTGNVRFHNSGGSTIGYIQWSGSSTSYNTSSDYRLKTDAQPMTSATDRVLALNPVNFEWIADGTRVDGFLAHEAQAVVPECVTGTKDAMRDEEYEVTPAVLDVGGNETKPAVMGTRSVPDMQGIDQSKMVPLLVAALQEALARITALEEV